MPFDPPAEDSSIFVWGGIAATAANNIYIGGLIRRQYADEAGVPFIARWDGSQWNRVTVSYDIPAGQMDHISYLTASESAGTVFAVLAIGGPQGAVHWSLLEISGNSASAVWDPLTSAGGTISAMSIAPDGALYLAWEERVVWRRDNTWKEHVLGDGWKAHTVYVDTTGRVWVGATRRNRHGGSEDAIIEIVDL